MAEAMDIARPATVRGGVPCASGCAGSTRRSRRTSTSRRSSSCSAVFGLVPARCTRRGSRSPTATCSTPTRRSSGSQNYAALLHDSYFWNALENTLGIWVLSTVPQLLMALGDRPPAEHEAARRARSSGWAILLPQVTSLVAVALIFTQLFGYHYGLVNYVLHLVGIHNVDWEAGPFIVLDRDLDDGDLALDRLQRADLPGRDAGDPASCTRRPRSTARAVAAVPPRHDPDAPPDDHLHGHHLDDRRDPAVHRAVPVPAAQAAAAPAASDRQYQTVAMYLYEKAFGGSSSTSAAPRRSPGRLFLLIVVISPRQLPASSAGSGRPN